QDAVVTIKGKGNYKGSVKYSYYIYEASISDLYCTAADKFGDTDNGYMNPVITIEDGDGKKLTKNKDFRIVNENAYECLKDNDGNETAQYQVSVEGIGNYYGNAKIKYYYMDKSVNLAKTKVKGKIPEQRYTLEGVTLANSDLEDLLYSVSGNVLVPGQDFEVDRYKNNAKTGTASVILKGKGDYAGIKTVKFKITDGKKRTFLGWLIDKIWK
nr:hypothetical protein [Lachnospiraceae bacterium]